MPTGEVLCCLSFYSTVPSVCSIVGSNVTHGRVINVSLSSRAQVALFFMVILGRHIGYGTSPRYG